MKTKTLDVRAAGIGLDEVLSLVEEGTEVILAEGETPLARVLPIRPARPRVAGLHAGAVWASDDFDEPLPEEFWATSR